jgi:hypothetical protein
MRWQADELATIDAWRRKQDDLPSRTAAIRRLVDQALAGTAAPRKHSEQTSRKAD